MPKTVKAEKAEFEIETAQEMAQFRYHFGPMSHMAQEYVKNIKIKEGQSILDFGCACGDVAATLAKRCPESPILAWTPIACLQPEAARTLGPYSNAEAVTGSFAELDVNDGIDVLISCYCLHCCPDKAQAMKDMWNALVPGGRAFLQFPVVHGRKRFEDSFELDLCLSEPWSEYFEGGAVKVPGPPLLSPDEFDVMATELGFKVVQAEIVRYQHPFPNRQALGLWLMMKLNHLLQVPPEKHLDFVKAVLDRHELAFPPDKKGRVYYFEHLLEIELKKPR